MAATNSSSTAQRTRFTAAETKALYKARQILDRHFRAGGVNLSSPQAVRDYLRQHLAGRPHEVFCCMWLDAQNRLIEFEELFRGTLTQTSVYPREIVKAALAHNAAAVLFCHNHPSGVPEPSRADMALTDSLKTALGFVDVKVLDHFIVSDGGTTSFAERGLI